MPVHFRRDELPASAEESAGQVVWKAQAGPRFAGLGRAFRCGLWVSIPGAIGLCFGLDLMKPALKAAAALSDDTGFWREMGWSLLLFGLYGAVLGAAIAWRVTSASGVGGVGAWVVAGGNLILVGLTAIVASQAVIFAGNVPFTCWTGLGLLAVGAVVGVYLTSLWYD
jgi:hypothetical protein